MYCMNIFNKSFHHRYSKGKCHPNPYRIKTNSKYTGPIECKSILLPYFRIFFSLMVLVTLKMQMFMLISYHKGKK